jgi:hypothetical protein
MVGVSSKWSFALVLLIGIVWPGFLDYLLSAAGASQLGGAVWALGYGTMVLVIWYGWIRPLNLTGPDTTDEQTGTVDGDPALDENSVPVEGEKGTTTRKSSDNGT